jgi:hypothetical protein
MLPAVRRRVRREVADIKHSPLQLGLRWTACAFATAVSFAEAERRAGRRIEMFVR